jgi:putative exosortase-associated protein (TIGR04073 family)
MHKILVIFLIFNLFVFPSFAQDHNPLRKLARGIVNSSLGWIEFPRQMIKVGKETNELEGFFWGSFKGLAFSVGRTLIGIYEIASFLIPSYAPIVEPEFIFPSE